jgi:hypothetical protein
MAEEGRVGAQELEAGAREVAAAVEMVVGEVGRAGHCKQIATDTTCAPFCGHAPWRKASPSRMGPLWYLQGVKLHTAATHRGGGLVNSSAVGGLQVGAHGHEAHCTIATSVLSHLLWCAVNSRVNQGHYSMSRRPAWTDAGTMGVYRIQVLNPGQY